MLFAVLILAIVSGAAMHLVAAVTVREPQKLALMNRSACLSYAERYKECQRIKSLPQDERSRYFYSLNSPFATELVAIRASGKNYFAEDTWLHTCSVLVESTRGQLRNVAILVMSTQDPGQPYHAQYRMPDEFKPFVEVFYQQDLRKLFASPPFTSAFANGDLAFAYILKRHPEQYDFLWVVEMDLRFIGDWGQLMTYARSYGDAHVGSSLNLSTEFPLGPVDLVTFSLFEMPQSTIWWHSRQNVFGLLLEKYDDLPFRGGGWTSIWGFTRAFSDIVYKDYTIGTGSRNQDSSLPMIAAFHRRKLVEIPVNSTYHCCGVQGKILYQKWITEKDLCYTNHLIHPIGNSESMFYHEFLNLGKLTNILRIR